MKSIIEYQLFHVSDFSLTVGNIIFSIGVIIANILFIKIISGLISRHFKKKGDKDRRQYSIIKLVKYLMWTFAFILALQALGLNITFLIASSAALLVGFGIGMQIIFKDFMSGIILLMEGIIKRGDIVEVEGEVLKVREISWRTSRVITREDKVVIIPNHKFTEENVINWSHNLSPTRFVIEVGVDYSSNLEIVPKCLLESVVNNADVIQVEEHAPFVRFNNFGSSSLDFQLVFWSDNLFRIESTKSVIRFEIARIFKENNITIPFTQVVIHNAEK